jgi:hypothetical protein
MRAMRFLALAAILSVGCSGMTTLTPTDAGNDAAMSGDTSMTPVCPKKYGTFVVVGDSISDVGSGSMLDKQKPFYRELLVANDDNLYPDWKGKDFTTCWGSPNVVKVSKGGAIATEGTTTGASVLFDQVKALPMTLPGPVLVVGTIGGNDVQRALPDVLLGNDVSAQLAAFKKGVDDAFGELTKTDRFGAGVKVDVLLTNIYDPSGGNGNFTFPDMTKCPGVLGFYPANKPTDPLLKPWEDAMAASAMMFGVTLLDLQTLFKPHAVSSMDGWFFSDCIHPNSAGHEHIRELFWGAIPR